MKHRTVALAILIIGALLLVDALFHVLPITTSLRFLVALVGALYFGLSFVKPHQASATAPAPLTLYERITGVFYRPSEVFENLKHHPQWLEAFLLIAVCSVGYNLAFTQRVTPEVIAGAVMDRTIESGWVAPDQAAEIKERQIEESKKFENRIADTAGRAVNILVLLLIAASFYLIGVKIFGGRLNLWQSLSVAAFSALPPLVIQNLMSILILFLQSPDEIDPFKGQGGLARADLGLLFAPSKSPVLYVLASSFSLFSIYGLTLAAIGLHRTSQKLTLSAAWTSVLTPWGLALSISVLAAVFFPSFIN